MFYVVWCGVVGLCVCVVCASVHFCVLVFTKRQEAGLMFKEVINIRRHYSRHS